MLYAGWILSVLLAYFNLKSREKLISALIDRSRLLIMIDEWIALEDDQSEYWSTDKYFLEYDKTFMRALNLRIELDRETE